MGKENRGGKSSKNRADRNESANIGVGSRRFADVHRVLRTRSRTEEMETTLVIRNGMKRNAGRTTGQGARGIIKTDFPARSRLIASRTTVTRDHLLR